MLSGLDPLDYRGHGDWFALMKECHRAGVGREEWIAWCRSDPKYANDDEIEMRWDSLRIGNSGRRVEARLAELTDAKHYPSPIMEGRACQVPIVANAKSVRSKYTFQHRIDALVREVRKGQEDLLFWAGCVMRELIQEGQIKPDVAVRLLESGWRGDRKQCRRTIAAAFLTVEEKLTNIGDGDGKGKDREA